MSELTEHEKQFLALAIQGLCMHGGPDFFEAAVRIAEKLGIKEQLGAYLQDWIAYNREQHLIEKQNEDRR